MRIATHLFVVIAMVFPLAAGAAEFVPIAPIPGLPTNTSAPLSEYVNIVFNLAITVGAVAAVMMIAYGGIEYMLSAALPQQKDGKTKIQNAFLGLALLLLVYLILFVINPDLVSLKALEQ
ncbi:MAG: hypothetical protein RLZZ283_41 [Candidatus Parcubacteria bacterium]|jgi:undecaprenyl pyrophosphate phosphatase UppP